MNPDNNQVQGDNEEIKKLEEDLKNLKVEESASTSFESQEGSTESLGNGSKKSVLSSLFKLFIGTVILGAAIYGLIVTKVKNSNLSKPSSSPISTATPISTSKPEVLETDKKYTDTAKKYEFYYPADWKVLTKIPDNFLYHDFSSRTDWLEYINTQEGLNFWLSGKMFAEGCRGPVLQNTKNEKEIIAFEVVDADGDGGFCWSVGYFYEGDKWKVAEEYAYPYGKPSADQRMQTPEWKGDFFKFESVTDNPSYKVFAGLANRETFSLSGVEAFRKMTSTFKFSN